MLQSVVMNHATKCCDEHNKFQPVVATAGQSRLRVEVQKLASRVAKTEAKQALLADQYDRILQDQAQHFAGGLQPQNPVCLHEMVFLTLLSRLLSACGDLTATLNSVCE